MKGKSVSLYNRETKASSWKASDEEKGGQIQKMVQYLIPLVEQERAHPNETILGALVKAHEQGEDVISQREMLSFAIGLIAAGFETVSTTFTNSAFNLLQMPELLEQMRERVDDPARMAQAIEELLRVTSLGGGGALVLLARASNSTG